MPVPDPHRRTTGCRRSGRRICTETDLRTLGNLPPLRMSGDREPVPCTEPCTDRRDVGLQ